MAKEYLVNKDPKKAFMMSNEAMVRGALEADVKVISCYPGAPTSEILDTFFLLRNEFDYKFTTATNEKVALETVAGASMSGFRALTSMKSVGLNVASDAFFSLAYTGINAGCVMIVADDPHCHSSQSEEDGRFFGPNAYIPMLEPSNPKEARKMVKTAFEISERHKSIVVIRTTTRVNHQSGIVETEALNRTPFVKAKWSEVGENYFTVGETARQNKFKLLEKVKNIQIEFEDSPFNVISEGEGDIGILTSGVGYCYAKDACKILKINPKILKIGTPFPLPEKKIADFMKGLSKVVVIEELSPYLEHNAKRIAKDFELDVTILGKDAGHFSEAMEYNVPIVVMGISSALGIKSPIDYDGILKRANDLKTILPERMPCFCAGCPHRATFWAIKQAVRGRNVVFNNDIGCYSMAFFPPLNMTMSLLCMGSSLGLSAGMSQVLEDDVMCVVGDSTFFHAALPGLVNSVYHNLNITLFVLDNEVTAMTGQQFHAGTPEDRGMPEGKKRIIIEDVCRGIGVGHVAIMDSYDVKNNVDIIKEALDFKGPSVVISRRSCALHGDRIKRRTGVPIVQNEVDKSICKKPHTCIKDFYCPSFRFDSDDRAARILPEICDGCGVCAKICPFGTIHPIGEEAPGREVKQ
ncbi:MAG: indolepyruvate ferredoxin oxidoreductase subunit alpha [Thermoplasmata archaeon]|nr:MAG: indolepyruvate ferredoxin oxidoreductase subunit alpha [Thermoplasmata archaeon]